MDKTEWEYFKIAPNIDVRLVPREDEPLIYEPIALVCSSSFERSTHDGILTPHDVSRTRRL